MAAEEITSRKPPILEKRRTGLLITGMKKGLLVINLSGSAWDKSRVVALLPII